MEFVNIALGLSNIFVAILVICLSIPLMLGKVRMNSFYGVRFRKSFESESNWYIINKYGAKVTILWSIPLLIFGVVIFFIPLNDNSALVTLAKFAPLIVLVPCYQSYKFAKNR